VPGPRHRADDHAVTGAAHPRRLSLHERERRCEIQRTPATPTLAQVKARTATPAHATTITLQPVRSHGHHDLALIAAVNVLNHHRLQAKQPGPYPCSAHVASASSGFQPSRSRNPRSGAACALPQPLTSPTETTQAPENRSQTDTPTPTTVDQGLDDVPPRWQLDHAAGVV
jgi:hypothetical protein